MKNLLLPLFILLLLGCQNTPSDAIAIVKKDKEKAMQHWAKAKSGHQFSDYHRIHYDSVLLFYPDSSDLVQRYSYSYKKTGEHIKAMELLNQAVDLKPKEALGYRAWSMLYYYRNYEKTITDIDTLMNLTNSCMEVCWGEPCKYHRFLALYKLERYDEALNEIQELTQCEKDYGWKPEDNNDYNFYIARIYQKLNQHKKAMHYFDKLLANESSILSEYLYYKAVSHLAISEEGNACELFQRAFQEAEKGNTFSDPYIELFDKVYPWMVKDELEVNCNKQFN